VFRASTVARTAAFVALGVTVGFVLAGVPNLELITLTVFLGGAASGPLHGAQIGALTALLFSGMNPLGLPPPLVLLAQLAGMTSSGLSGGLLGPRLARRPTGQQVWLLGGLGLMLTLLYDVLTNGAIGLHFGPILPTLIAGLGFAVLHIVTNTVAFAVLGVSGLRVLGDLGQLERNG